jgi:hypothetical protein
MPNNYLRWDGPEGVFWFQGPGRWCDDFRDATALTAAEARVFKTDCERRNLLGKFKVITC